MSPFLRAAGAIVAVALLFLLLVPLASLSRAPLTVDVGPSTGAYLEGFTESEERLPVTFRWTTERSAVELPFRAEAGPAELVVRYARFLPGFARVHVFVSGERAASFDARSGRFRTQRLAIRLPEGRVRLELLVEDPEESRLGIAIDWLRIERARAAPTAAALVPLAALLSLALWLPVAGAGVLPSALAAALGAVAAAVWLARDPFGAVHVASALSLSFLVLVGLVALLARRLRERWLVVVFAVGFLLKGAGIFYPSYFYPDVRNHRRYVFALADAGGSLSERGVAAQVQVRTAFPRRVGDRDYAFPYSPLFFVPFTWLPRDAHLVESAFKHVALAAAALEVVAVYVLARGISGARLALLASALTAFLPPMYSRLFLAMWPTVVGHLLDLAVIAAAAAWARRPKSASRLLGLGAASLAALLTYISSLFNVTSFLGALAALREDLRWRLAAVAALAVAVTVVGLYLPFTLLFVREILPELVTGGGESSAADPSPSLLAALGRVTFFYGYAYPVLALAGLGVLWRARKREASPLVAYGMSFLLLVALRQGFGMFRDLKEILYVGPLIAIGAAASLGALAARGRIPKLAAVALLASLVPLWLGTYRSLFEAHASLAGVAGARGSAAERAGDELESRSRTR